MTMIVSKIFFRFFFFFLSLVTAPFIKNCHILPEIFFTFLKKRRRLNLKILYYQTYISVQKSESSYQVRPIFVTFLQIKCSNFRLKLLKALALPKLLNKSSLKGLRVS